MEKLLSQMMCVCLFLSGRVSPTQLTCETLMLLSTNLTARTLVFLNQTFGVRNSSGVFCDLSVDGIGTCWPLSAAGQLISRPCPEQFNGIHYNTSILYQSEAATEVLANQSSTLCGFTDI
ncbi:hypothetical protein PFLUV_G00185230 [Perca fluviatilis]|uniref:G-protein coupled receptors family 2 profile 1 domain-containing protein n=1 Tax=Perca fluviatilis TaxID=8168 RepID=A0A6A5EXC8_PERFL|nr:hypothetical protein PFLUV_G00185230 [Perca fluviatilis]